MFRVRGKTIASWLNRWLCGIGSICWIPGGIPVIFTPWSITTLPPMADPLPTDPPPAKPPLVGPPRGSPERVCLQAPTEVERRLWAQLEM